jgi:fructosamine-3-kinase
MPIPVLPAHLKETLESQLSLKFHKAISITAMKALGGGCINDAHRIETSSGAFFMKYNRSEQYPCMFEKEAMGLELLGSAGEVRIPGVILHGESEDLAFLVLELVTPAPRIEAFWDEFGASLARLHRHHGDHFGLGHDNYIGSLPQSNKKHSDWISFFIEERLERQACMARDSGTLGRSFTAALERLYKKLPEIFPPEKPSLIHGDLWNGNFMADDRGLACLIDPAVYYGHREMDLAMSRLFGGFDRRFYESYEREFPLEKGWRERIDICNLYPLLVHVNLFEGGYGEQVMGTLRRF